MNEVNQLLGGLGDALRALAAQFTSIWLPIQLAVLLVAALVAGVVATIVRRRVDLLSPSGFAVKAIGNTVRTGKGNEIRQQDR